jgi:hypothetical protein
LPSSKMRQVSLMSNDFEVTVPNGTLLVHMQKCDAVGTCYRSTWVTEISGDGDFEIVTRESAICHTRDTGHEVDYVTGTIETMVPLRIPT